jgi:uncharacterized repeat protein (TIGR03803 family)
MRSPHPLRNWPAACACLLLLILPAFAGLEVVASFQKPGTQATGKLRRLANGESYGTASSGGAQGFGSVFRVTAAGAVETVVSFTGSSGAVPGSGPTAGLVLGADSAFYGTTSAGGAGGFGTIFKLTAAGVFTQLVDFTGTTGTAKGSVPGPLVLHADGNFYGTTAAGGAGGFGTVFKMTPGGSLTTLAEFTGTAGAFKGSEPTGALAISGTTLYGVSRIGGAVNVNLGTIFRITTAGSFTALHDFTGPNGARPAGGLFLHSNGLLYGTTEFGGTEGFGTAFSLSTAVTPVFTSIRSFADLIGSQPVGELVAADATTLLGTLATGGASGWGGIYKLTTGGVFTMLATFTGESGIVPGAAPRAGLVADGGGLFHGVTSAGGPGNLGTVFKINAAGSYSVTAHLSPPAGWMPSGAPAIDPSGGLLFPLAAGGSAGGGTLATWTQDAGLSVAAMLGGAFGSAPDGGLLLKAGAYYGLASQGAASGRGAAFRYQPGTGLSLVNAFTSTGGALPEGALIDGSDGALYGIGREGGTSARGTVFKVTTAGVRTRIVSFTGTAGASPGSTPRGPLVLAANQNYYGVTASGGSSDKGVLFKISPLGTYSVLAHFTTTGPRLPAGGLVMGTDGFIYGSCSSGGTADAGTLIRLNPADDTWSVVASFDGTTAASPAGELHAAADGTILGIATAPGNGGVFRFTAAGGLQIVAAFDGNNGRATADNGAGLVFTGGLTTTPQGVILGTAPGGGPAGGGVLFLIAGDSPLNRWKSQHLGSPLASDDDDPDRDGLPTVVEYALGKIPTLPDAAGQPAASIATNFLRLTVPRDPARNDIVMIVEATSDLAAWTSLATSINGSPFTGPGYLSGETPGNGMKSVVVRDLVPVTSAPRRFLRLRVLSGFAAATPLEIWKMTYLGDPAAPDDGDPDLDGHVNLLEYALGTLPTVPDATPPPASIGGGFLRLTVPRDPARNDVTLTVEATANLSGPWTPLATSTNGTPFSGPGYLSGETPGPSLKSVLVRDIVAVSSVPRRFIRLRVTR